MKLGVLLSLMVASTASAESEPATAPPPYAPYFNPAKGFEPVNANLAKVFLKLAGSLEFYGTPEPYLRHVMAEHARIDAEFHAKGGKGSSRPAYLTDAYVDNLIANWNKIAPPLKLDEFSREAGRNMRYAILGSKNMSIPELVAFETSLNDTEKSAYRQLLEKPYFTKKDFPVMEAFYDKAFDELTETGKDQVSHRTKLGTMPPEKRAKLLAEPASGTALVRLFNKHQDATVAYLEDRKNNPKTTADTLEVLLLKELKLETLLAPPKNLQTFEAEPLIYAHKIRAAYMRRVISVRQQIKPKEEAVIIEETMQLMLENLLVLAQSEFEAAIYEKMTE